MGWEGCFKDHLSKAPRTTERERQRSTVLSPRTEGKQSRDSVALPVTHDLPGGESWVLTDQRWVILSRCSKQLVCADVTLRLSGCKVPVGQSKGLVADESLKAKVGSVTLCMCQIRHKVCKAMAGMFLGRFYSKTRNTNQMGFFLKSIYKNMLVYVHMNASMSRMCICA